jgi:hypothetical protein
VAVGETVPLGTPVAVIVADAVELASYQPRGG